MGGTVGCYPDIPLAPASSPWPEAPPPLPLKRSSRRHRAMEFLSEAEFCMMEKIWHSAVEVPSRPSMPFLRCLLNRLDLECKSNTRQQEPTLWCSNNSWLPSEFAAPQRHARAAE